MSGPARPILPVILCGGAGTRLWPVSTEAAPKPFHALLSDESLFQATVRRVSSAAGGEFLPPMIVCGRMHRGLVETQLAAMDARASLLVLEPCGRGTAPIAAIASRLAAERWPEALVLMLSADHLIADEAEFRRTIGRGAAIADDWIVTLGIAPTRPETGYGYIRRGAALGEGLHAVDRFVEKPDLARAAEFAASGEYSWNAGVFLFSPRLMLGELQAARPDIAEAAIAALPAHASGALIELDEARFHACPAEAIDRAVMERTARAAVAIAAFDWADIGAWDEVWRLSRRDGAQNAVRGDVDLADVGGSLVWSDGPTVAAIGVTDLVIVATGKAVLVVPRARAQEVRAIAERLAGRGPDGGGAGRA
ncbi:MAG TPA: sugar phosphate nucleotidyltransferase [Caulobacteraceae bacterium]|nr:sugar phosphate nucleotidyltransferase [Caulobacteraceae bacterium]